MGVSIGYIWFAMTLSYKMQVILLQNAIGVLLQNATTIYYKMCQVFYIDRFIKKYDVSVNGAFKRFHR